MRHSTPRQLIKVVFGLRGQTHGSVIQFDSTLMDMDAPECLPAGSTRRVEPLRDHADPAMRGYFLVCETIAFREALANGEHC